uniref:Uncharacterized protein n=1 Tax=Trypanosoma vivax (strain Y486) TaxID=1055687 RepID=G0TV19_TRYVY|nr:hypothetical protein, unlikely [Trypanosoma vivax Y486]
MVKKVKTRAKQQLNKVERDVIILNKREHAEACERAYRWRHDQDACEVGGTPSLSRYAFNSQVASGKANASNGITKQRCRRPFKENRSGPRNGAREAGKAKRYIHWATKT